MNTRDFDFNLVWLIFKVSGGSSTDKLGNSTFMESPLSKIEDFIELKSFVSAVIYRRRVKGEMKLGDAKYYFESVMKTVGKYHGEDIKEMFLCIKKCHNGSEKEVFLDYRQSFMLDAGLQKCIYFFGAK